MAVFHATVALTAVLCAACQANAAAFQARSAIKDDYNADLAAIKDLVSNDRGSFTDLLPRLHRLISQWRNGDIIVNEFVASVLELLRTRVRDRCNLENFLIRLLNQHVILQNGDMIRSKSPKYNKFLADAMNYTNPNDMTTNRVIVKGRLISDGKGLFEDRNQFEGKALSESKSISDSRILNDGRMMGECKARTFPEGRPLPDNVRGMPDCKVMDMPQFKTFSDDKGCSHNKAQSHEKNVAHNKPSCQDKELPQIKAFPKDKSFHDVIKSVGKSVPSSFKPERMDNDQCAPSKNVIGGVLGSGQQQVNEPSGSIQGIKSEGLTQLARLIALLKNQEGEDDDTLVSSIEYFAKKSFGGKSELIEALLANLLEKKANSEEWDPSEDSRMQGGTCPCNIRQAKIAG